VYNVEDYLPRCLESILAQTWENLEVIIVNDGSTDGSLDICRRYESLDDRITVYCKENGGLGSARDHGLQFATGRIISFIDSDDYLEPDGLQYLAEDMLAHDADLVIAPYVIDDFDGIRQTPHVAEAMTIEGPAALMEAYFCTEYIKSFAWNKLYRAELWKDIRFPHYYSSEDNATCYKIFDLVNRARVLPRPFYHYVMRDSSIDRNFARNIEKDFVSIEAAEERYRFVSRRYPELERQADENRWQIWAAMIQRLFASGAASRYRPLLREWIAFFRENEAPSKRMRGLKIQISCAPYLYGGLYCFRYRLSRLRRKARLRCRNGHKQNE